MSVISKYFVVFINLKPILKIIFNKLIAIFIPSKNQKSLCLMYKIVEKEIFSENVIKLVIEAPEISRSRKPGHFVIVRIR